jgi:phage-related protein
MAGGQSKVPASENWGRGTWRQKGLVRLYEYMYNDMELGRDLKPVRWVGTSLRELRACPRAVRLDIGQALFTAQDGNTDPAAKPLKGFGGASVMEIVVSHQGNAWRAVYTVRFAGAIYVLHVFQKKSTRGIATPAREMELIKRRVTEAERDYRRRRN